MFGLQIVPRVRFVWCLQEQFRSLFPYSLVCGGGGGVYGAGSVGWKRGDGVGGCGVGIGVFRGFPGLAPSNEPVPSLL